VCMQPGKWLWLVIDSCVNFVDVCIVIFGIYFYFLNFLRHQPVDIVQKYNSFNTRHYYIAFWWRDITIGLIHFCHTLFM
jgi:hypothetical protein